MVKKLQNQCWRYPEKNSQTNHGYDAVVDSNFKKQNDICLQEEGFENH